MALPLSDYALIGNARAAALVCNTGSVDWCCLPEFDSPAIFAALLDDARGGYFSIRPVGKYTSRQRYLEGTNVVETVFETADGQARLLDAFTVQTEEDKTRALFPDHELLRVVEAVSGSITFRLEYVPRTYYGKNTPRLQDRKRLGIHFAWHENIYTLLSTLEPGQFAITESMATAAFTVAPGAQVSFSLSYSSQSPAVLPELRETGFQRMIQSINYWQSWSSRCRYEGLYKEEVLRSVLALKLLTHAPSGAIVAAPTTSLPEELGGERNWDYRYCWLRDASFTIRVLVKLGYTEEAHAYMNWILHATRLTRPKLQVVYSVFGHASLKEQVLGWLTGYQNSTPVRIGNGADKQFQLDVYGEVLDAVHAYAPLVEVFDRDTRKFLLGLGQIICRSWQQPDNGIWEIRADLALHTHSKVMAWVGLDRLLKLARKYKWEDAPVQKFSETKDRIRESIEEAGYNQELQTYTRAFRGNDVDASLLTLPLVGYCPASAERMRSTTKMICQQLLKHKLLYRYRGVTDGLEGGEGAFGICNFWLVEVLARSGEPEQARELFDTLLKHASPAGLLSEEIDPETGALLGNYPQGFTHIGLINAALALNEVYQQQEQPYAYK
ncbi:glycoside hydrolase family 15 protein [Pontibacter chinhatensis]|uniref:Glucoamylase (Glucan-1,4-alpha-glucosidase), GH15 family n=1 Tax=Pontibacter chinhatensis TaxID=1436961 RepID=A0A1I2ZFH5_9BACT|nr:glycoside hydrolase family 15 protein [Pontibacter chinhatensis]SFH36375.1 Glucoamylase (glucan-1,4-alpha-glucosidase), GH15 family [Pontibacter chinhatensis]